jgi:hypothetical protein
LGIIVDNPSTAGTATIYYGDSITIDATSPKDYNVPTFYFGQYGTTTINEVTNNVTATIIANGRKTVKFNKILAPGTSVKIERQIQAPYPAICDGGCYCWCGNEQNGPDITICPGVFESVAEPEIVYIGEVIRITPYIATGYTLDSMVVNNNYYDNTNKIVVINAGDEVNITVDTTATSKWRTLSTGRISISGSKENTSHAVYGLDSTRKTRFTVSSGTYSCTKEEIYPAEFDGCYFYCHGIESGGSECADYYHKKTSIIPRYYVTENNNAVLETEDAVSNACITVTNNQIIFQGYFNYADYNYNYSKEIVISKIEQYYE